jgi:integrase
VSSFSKAAEKARKLAAVPHWTLHDLRRAARTGLAQTGASIFVAEPIIAHAQSGVHAVYDLHKYDAEKRAALAAWEARLLRIVGKPAPAAPNIVAMPARKRA